MTAKNSSSVYVAEHFGDSASTVTIRCYNGRERQPAEYKLSKWLRSSLPVVLSTGPEPQQCIHPDSSLDKTYELLISVFSLPGAYIFRRVNNGVSQACSKRTGKAKLRCLRYPRFISNYLQNCQRIGGDSLCKKMLTITCGQQSTPFAGSEAYVGLPASFEKHHGQLVKTACLLIKYKKCLNQQCQRCTSTSELSTTPTAGVTLSDATKSEEEEEEEEAAETEEEEGESKHARQCDKTVQCSKSTEFLKVSPELRFFSRSSLVINHPEPGKSQQQQQQQRRFTADAQGCDLTVSPSLEYVANYRPEFCQRSGEGEPNLRSFSSSAIFGLQSGDSRARTVTAARSADVFTDKNYFFSQKSRGRKRERRIERIRELLQRTENEMLRYSNFIEDDLSSLRGASACTESNSPRAGGVVPADIQAVKKILLEDYITEVREIVRSESCQLEQEREARILEELKHRMDEDLATPPAEPAPSLRPAPDSRPSTCRSRASCCSCERSSYETAAECCCCCCCYCYCRHCQAKYCCDPAECDRGKCSNAHGGSCLRMAGSLLQRVHGLRVADADMSKTCPTCVENIARRRDWLKEDLWTMGAKAKSSHSLDSGVLTDCPRQAGDWTFSDESSARQAENREEFGSFSGLSCTDEVLCQRVESAVRKFTEELILCERRARDRSRSNRKRRDKWRVQAPPRDQSVFNYPRNSHCSSEDEFITGISTPSLVSLSDSEIPTSLQT